MLGYVAFAGRPEVDSGIVDPLTRHYRDYQIASISRSPIRVRVCRPIAVRHRLFPSSQTP